MLNPNAKKWVEALRSGEYQQRRNALCECEAYCCLGVACEVYQREVGDLDVTENGWNTRRYDGAGTSLPHKVQEWLGLTDRSGYYNGRRNCLMLDNDVHRKTFAEIADIIESEPEGLFVCETEKACSAAEPSSPTPTAAGTTSKTDETA